jgi:hypothetical protein
LYSPIADLSDKEIVLTAAIDGVHGAELLGEFSGFSKLA